jgi:hypothetical protein
MHFCVHLTVIIKLHECSHGGGNGSGGSGGGVCWLLAGELSTSMSVSCEKHTAWYFHKTCSADAEQHLTVATNILLAGDVDPAGRPSSAAEELGTEGAERHHAAAEQGYSDSLAKLTEEWAVAKRAAVILMPAKPSPFPGMHHITHISRSKQLDFRHKARVLSLFAQPQVPDGLGGRPASPILNGSSREESIPARDGHEAAPADDKGGRHAIGSKRARRFLANSEVKRRKTSQQATKVAGADQMGVLEGGEYQSVARHRLHPLNSAKGGENHSLVEGSLDVNAPANAARNASSAGGCEHVHSQPPPAACAAFGEDVEDSEFVESSWAATGERDGTRESAVLSANPDSRDENPAAPHVFESEVDADANFNEAENVVDQVQVARSNRQHAWRRLFAVLPRWPF